MSSRPMFLFAALVNVVGGLLFGYGVGFVPIYTTFNDYNTNCTGKLSEVACNDHDLKPASCVWVSGIPEEARRGGSRGTPSKVNNMSSQADSFFSGSSSTMDSSGHPTDEGPTTFSACLFKDYLEVNCSWGEFAASKEGCASHPGCQWHSNAKQCHHQSAWTPTMTGFYASAMVIGCIFGCLGVPPVVDLMGRRRCLFVIGSIAVVASVLAQVSQANGSYSLLIVARILIGVGGGAACVVCPMYAEEMGPEKDKNPLVVLLQIAMSGGICIAAGLGLALEPRDFSQPMEMSMRMSVMNAFQWFTALVCFPVAYCIPESTVWLTQQAEKGKLEVVQNGNGQATETANLINKDEAETHSTKKDLSDDDDAEPPEKLKYVEHRKMSMPLIIIVSLVLSASQQFTGINAIMNYAPSLAAAAGMNPLTGNFIIMLWNLITPCIAFPVAKKFSPRNLYLVGTVIASLACLVNGIPVYPGILDGVMSKESRQILAGVGILGFIAAYEITMGPVFYMLAVEIFPLKYRSKGCAFTNLTAILMNVGVNFGFPVCVVALSGGESGDQNKGMGLMFIIFGLVGLTSVPPLWKWLYPAPIDGAEEDKDVEKP